MVEYKQDMPPPGGYPRLLYSRIPLKPGLPIGLKYALGFAFCSGCFLIYNHTKDKYILEKVEMRCARFAIRPMLEAERDRLFLKQIRKNRDDEEKLMKDVPCWEVGKWKNYPVYLTLKPDEFYFPHEVEYFAHADPKIRDNFRNVLVRL